MTANVAENFKSQSIALRIYLTEIMSVGRDKNDLPKFARFGYPKIIFPCHDIDSITRDIFKMFLFICEETYFTGSAKHISSGSFPFYDPDITGRRTQVFVRAWVGSSGDT